MPCFFKKIILDIFQHLRSLGRTHTCHAKHWPTTTSMMTLDDMDLLSFRAFLITTCCNYILIQSLEADYLLSLRPSSLLFGSNPTHILNFLTCSELWSLPASNILEYAKLHSREVNNIICHFEEIINKIQDINMPGTFPLHSDLLYFWFILVIQLILPLPQFLNWWSLTKNS